jgi:serine/threonine protein kinase
MIKNIGIRIINILEDIHNRGIIHGDIKPGCFLIDNYQDFNIFILDFGFSSEINQITGIPMENESPFIGDITYASKNRFLGFPASKRDDIISLGYMLIYFMKGSLPWGISKNYSNVKQMKLSISIERLCYGLPIEIKDFMNYAYNLKSNENPDYYYLRNTLNRCEDNNFNIKNNEFNDLDFKECLGDIAKALSDPKMLNQILNDSKIFNRAISDPKIFNNNIFN